MKKVKIEKQLLNKILEDYNNGISVPALNSKYGYSNTVLYRELRENNIKIKTTSEASRKYDINMDFFRSINENSMYWMGFILADGSFQKSTRSTYQLVIGLAIKDINHLKKFRRLIQPEIAITEIKPKETDCFKNNGSCRISISSTEICEDIWKFGITPNKSKEVILSDEVKFNKHFWRGFVDGDGYLGYIESGNNKHRLEVVGNTSTLNYFLDFCKIIIPNLKNQVKPHKNIYCIRFGGKTAKTILKELYSDSNMYLDRKKEKYNSIINL